MEQQKQTNPSSDSSQSTPYRKQQTQELVDASNELNYQETNTAKSEKKQKKTTAEYFLKILILGDTGVGKSSMLSSYINREFPKNIIGTAGIDHKVKDIMLQGKQLKIQVWDTAGQEKYKNIIKRDYYDDVCGIILMYDVSDEISFLDLTKYWIPKLNESLTQPVELMVIGNKIDLINQRQVTKQEAKKLFEDHPDLQVINKPSTKQAALKRLQIMKGLSGESRDIKYEIHDEGNHLILGKDYYETSAMDPDNVDSCFRKFLTKIINRSELRERILMSNQKDKARLSKLGQKSKFLKKKAADYSSTEDNSTSGSSFSLCCLDPNKKKKKKSKCF